MSERRRVRVTDWVNGSIGVVMIAFAGWAGSKLVVVAEDVSYVKAKVEGIKDLKEKVKEVEKKVDDIDTRLVKVEAKIK